MKVSAAGRAALTAREGLRTAAYLDTAGVPTIGVGHTGRMAPPAVRLGMTGTHAQIDAWLAADLGLVETAINALGAKLTQNQFDACASLAFNIGLTGFHNSTVARCLHKGDMAAAADAFLLWNKPAVLKGRREGERRQFLTPDNQVVPITVSAAPAAAKPPAAPVAAAPASSTATKKATTMDTSASALAAAHPQTAAVLPKVDFLQGAKDFVQGIVHTLESGAAAIASPKLPSITASSGIGTIDSLTAAAGKLKEILADVARDDKQEAAADAMDLLKMAMAVLTRYNVPYMGLVAGVANIIPSIHSGGVDKPA